MNKKEILIVTIALGNDGAERVLTELSNEWVKQGHDVTVLQTGAGNYKVSYKMSDAVKVDNIYARIRFKPLRYVQEISMLVKYLNQHKNATVLAFIVSSTFNVAVASFFVKNRIVFSERNDPRKCPSGRLQQKLRDWSFTRADACVFQTEDAMNMFPKKARKNGVIIPNPINGNLPERYTGERRKSIVTACRLHPQKNLPMLIRAFAMLSKEFPDYTLEIYGQGNEEAMLRELIAELGLEEKVLLPGFCSDIHSKMLDAAMFVSSSDYEGISNSMLEALGMGVPCVCTDCPVGGARLMIKNGENGVLVPVGDTQAMYEGMKKVLSDPAFAEQLSLNACKVKEELPIEKVSLRWLELL